MGPKPAKEARVSNEVGEDPRADPPLVIILILEFPPDVRHVRAPGALKIGFELMY